MTDTLSWVLSAVMFAFGLASALIGTLAAGEVNKDYSVRQGRAGDALLAFTLLMVALGLIMGAAAVMPEGM